MAPAVLVLSGVTIFRLVTIVFNLSKIKQRESSDVRLLKGAIMIKCDLGECSQFMHNLPLLEGKQEMNEWMHKRLQMTRLFSSY